MILICDGSPQETLQLVRSYSGFEKVKVFEFSSNSGNACRGRNKGIELAEGDYVVFLDDDDIAEPNRLKKTHELILKTGAGLIGGAIKFLCDGSRVINGIKNGDIAYSTVLNFKKAIISNPLYLSSVAVRRQDLIEFGAFKERMRYREDHELWVRLLYKGVRLAVTNDVLTIYRVHSKNKELEYIDEDIHWHNKLKKEYTLDP